jgi:hypothetical protein
LGKPRRPRRPGLGSAGVPPVYRNVSFRFPEVLETVRDARLGARDTRPTLARKARHYDAVIPSAARNLAMTCFVRSLTFVRDDLIGGA